MLFPNRSNKRRPRTSCSTLRRERATNLFYETLEKRQLLATITADASLTGVQDWTASSTWIGGNVPTANDRAIIPQNLAVVLNGTDHVVKELVIHGSLSVEETAGVDRTLKSNWIHVNSGGVFQVGTETDRYDQAEFTLTLTGQNPGQTFTVETATGSISISDNDSFLMAAGGGRLQFFGQEKLSFTKLATTADVNSSQITVENVIERNFDGTTSAASDGSVDWEVGDQIVIASSSEDYDDEEVRNITAITDLGNGTSRITLDSPLTNRHYGDIETYSNDTRTWDLDLRAEVALLSRNVRVEGEAWHDTDNNFGDRARFTETLGNTGDGFGGHIMIMGSAGQVTLDGVQLDKLGQTARLGRYPIHWHLAGDRTGDILRRTSITNSNNRGVTIHGTHNVLMQDVVLHDVHGHGFFMEDGVETGNQYIANIAFGIHKVGRSAAVGNFAPDLNDPFIVDTHDHVGQNANRFLSSASYWVTNPDNTWVGNISAGSEGTGFWFILPDSAIGVSANDPQYDNVRPDRTNLRQFDFNSSHASPAGLNFDRGSDIEVPVGGNLKEFFAGDNWLPPVEPQINNFTAYKHNVAIYHRGFDANFHDNRIADSDIGTFITFTQRITDTLYVGHSRGNADLSDSVTGHTMYDGANTLDGTHFAGFANSNAHTFRVHGSALRHTSHVMRNTSFEDDGSAGHVSVGSQGGGTNHNSPFNNSAAAIHDEDGTLTGHVGGGAGSTVVANIPFFYDSDDFRPAGWNAVVTNDLYSMIHFDPSNSNANFRVTAPDGDQITDEGRSRKTHVKSFQGGNALDPANDYLIELVSGSLTDTFDLRYWARTGPSGSTVLRLVGFGDTVRPRNMNRATTLSALRAATETTFTVVDGDIYIKAFTSSSDIEMRSFTSSSPNANNDLATTDAGTSVTIDLLSNDSDNDGDSLSVVSVGGASTGGSVVADYQDDYVTSGPTGNWQYLWNGGGAFGDPSNYSALEFVTWRFKPSNANFPYLSGGSAHPGDGTDEGSGIERLAIAAWTVTQDGEYSITDSALNNSNEFSDGVNVKVHVTGGSVSTLETIGTQESGSFDTSLGFLTAGQTIYVGVGANEDNGGDSSNPFDFSIRRSTSIGSTNGSVQVNGDGTVTYTPNPGFSGLDSFTYQVSDDRGGFDTANITVTVDPVAPVVTSFERVGGGNFDGTATLRPDLVSPVSFTFGEDVIVEAGDLEISNATLGGAAVDTAGIGFSYDSTTFTATWDLSVMTTPLEASFYDIQLDSSSIQSASSGLLLDGDENGEGGDPFSRSFYLAIPGDADLDGRTTLSIPNLFTRVNTGDVATARRNVGAATVSWALGDFDGNGEISLSIPNLFTRVNTGDVAVARRNVGRDVRPVSGATAALSLSKPSFATSSVATPSIVLPESVTSTTTVQASVVLVAVAPMVGETTLDRVSTPLATVFAPSQAVESAAEESPESLELETSVLRQTIFALPDDLDSQEDIATEETATSASESSPLSLSGADATGQRQFNDTDRDSLFADLGDEDADDDSLVDVAFPIAAVIE